MTLREQVIEKLETIYDPEIPVDIYNLGLIYDINFEMCTKGYYCNILMTFTSPNCPVADFLLASVNQKLSAIDDIYRVEIKLTFKPPWSPAKISPQGQEILTMDNVDL